MVADKQKFVKESGEQTRILPKNFRQIGDPGTKRIYMEDYVYTYLNKLAQPANLYARGAILFGKTYKTAAGHCLFISGAAACQNFEFDLEETVFSEENWGEIYRIRDAFFPDLEIVGWFLSRMGFSVELNDKIIRMHMDNFSGENKVLYMMDALENEDAFYQFENYALKKQKGYYLYYETNKEMKNYMVTEGEVEKEPEVRRKSNTLVRDASVVKNYKKALKQKKTATRKGIRKLNPTVLAAGLVIVMVLMYGVRSIIDFRQLEKTAPVFDQQDASAEKAENKKNDKKENSLEKETTAENMPATTDRSTVQEEIETQSTAETQSVYSQTFSSGTTGTTRIENETTESMQTESSQSSTTSVQAGESSKATEEQPTEDVFTQEEPDDAEEAWNYIGGYYTVKEGDTLAAISKKIYQSYDYVSAIAQANGILNVDQIYPGQILEMPQMEE